MNELLIQATTRPRLTLSENRQAQASEMAQ